MKTAGFWIGLLILSLATALLVSGCASAGSGKGAYPTLRQTRMNVDWPMTNFRNAVAAGRVTLGEQQQVNAAYAEFESAFKAAVQAAGSNYEVTTPDNVKSLANQVINAVNAIPQ
jgi:hypothetical protein